MKGFKLSLDSGRGLKMGNLSAEHQWGTLICGAAAGNPVLIACSLPIRCSVVATTKMPRGSIESEL